MSTSTNSADFEFEITPQPTESTCGPSSLHAVYRHYGHELELERLIGEVVSLPNGGTLAVMLGLDALRRGFEATIYTFDLKLFDPTWFRIGGRPIGEGLRLRAERREDATLRIAARAYIEFLERGGRLQMRDLSTTLLRRYLQRGYPIIAGLSATWLYQCARESQDPADPERLVSDDVNGESMGHFVVIHGLDGTSEKARVADPFLRRPYPGTHLYEVGLDRLIGAILLGITTYDAKLLIIHPRNRVTDMDDDADPAGGEQS